MLLKCIIIAIVYMLGNMDVRFFGAHRWNTPICLSALIGLAAGDLQVGIIMGVELQLIFLGFLSIGMSTMPDGAAGTTLAVAFAIMSGVDTTAAIALAMPIALLFQPLQILKNVILNWFNVKSDAYCMIGNDRGVAGCLHGANILAAVFDFVPMFLALYAGSSAVQALVNFLPEVVMAMLNKTAMVLPALGVAYLMSYVVDKFTMPFVFLGFALTSYLKLDSLAVAIFGLAAALIFFNAKRMLADR